MKPKRIIPIVLGALALVGCNPNISNTSTEKSSSNSVSSKLSVTDSTNRTSSKPYRTSSSKSKDSGITSESSSSVSSGWKDEIIEAMRKYLHGNVLPFFDIGVKSKQQYDYTLTDEDYGILTIEGKETYKSDTSEKINSLYTSNGFTLLKGGADFASYKGSDENLKVTFSKQEDTDLIEIKATYDESYDLQSASSNWDNDILTSMNNTFGEYIPYVYLGSSLPNIKVDKYAKLKMTIHGGKWNDQVLIDAKSTLEAQGYSVTTDSDSLTATTTSSTVSQFSITIKPLTKIETATGPKKKITMTIEMTESFNPNGLTSWTTDVENKMDTYLDGHSIPFIYLGTRVPSAYYYTSKDQLEITGNIYQDSILSTAKSTLDNDSWTTTLSDGTLTAEKTFQDTCKLSMTLTKDSSSSSPVMLISIDRSYVIPDGKNEWSILTQGDMQDNFQEVFPYVYLNEKDETTSFDEESKTLKIYGGFFHKKILDSAMATYSALKNSSGSSLYTITKESDTLLRMSKTEDGRTTAIVISKDENNKAYMTIKTE
jgi:hypothetical protein